MIKELPSNERDWLKYLTIDNYDDSIEYADEQKSVMIETTSRQMIFDWAKDNGIILKRYKEDGYLAVFNERITNINGEIALGKSKFINLEKILLNPL